MRHILITWRDDLVVPQFPQISRERGLLRRRMIDALLAWKPQTMDELVEMLPVELIRQTDAAQIREIGPVVVELIRRHCR